MFHDSPRRSTRSTRSLRSANRIRLAVEQTMIESLEARCLLASTGGNTSSDPFDVKSIPVYVPKTDDLNDVKHGPMGLAGTDLTRLYTTYRRAVKAKQPLKMSELVKTQLAFNGDGMVGVTLRTRGDFNRFAKDLKRNWAFDMTAAIESQAVVQGYMRLNDLRAMAARADVAAMTPIYAAYTRVGSANNQGDATLKTDALRSSFGVTGSGVKIGVISDSANQVGGGLQDSYRSGDLLASQVSMVRDSGGADEGRGMMELIHDIAPGASLAFASANGGQGAFAGSIAALRTNNVDMIVDDIGYADEPFFQPGIIEVAGRDFVNAGGVFFTAASNDQDSGFGQNAKYTTGPDPSSPSQTIQFIDFDPSSAASRRMTIVLPRTGDITLQWDNPWNGVSGNASTDFDVRLYTNGTNTIAKQSIDDNLVTGRPMEFLRDVDPGTYQIEIAVAGQSTGATLPTRFHFIAHDSEMSTTQFAGTRSSTLGHSGGVDFISVGAVDFFDAPPVSATTPIRNASFSSFGPNTYTFDSDGNRLATPITPQKPDISGPDGTNTSFFGDDIPEDIDGLPNFFGTSAAAPNVAAAVALIMGVNPSLTQAQILAGLKSTAIPLNGTASGVWDPQGGFGLVDANAAISTLVSAPTVDIVDVSPDPIFAAVNKINVTFNQPVTGVTRSDFTLTRNGGSNILNAPGVQIRNIGGGQTWELRGLKSLTSGDGTYVLTLNATNSGIKNAIGTLLTGVVSETWQKETPPPLPTRPADFAATALDSTSVRISFADNNKEEDGYTIQRSQDETFTTRTKTIQLPANTTTYTDTGLLPATRYFYRVRGFNVSGAGKYTSTANVTTAVGGVVVVDNDSPGAKAGGFWGTGSSGAGFQGTNYLQDGNSAKGTKSVRYTPGLAGDGVYFVYARWNRTSKNATNVPFDIFYGPNASLKQTILVDQRNRGGGSGWNVIGGPFQMNVGEGAGVRIRNTTTNGTVIADAIQFLPGAPLTAPGGGGNTNSHTSAYRPGGNNPFNNGPSINPNDDNNGDDNNGDDDNNGGGDGSML